MSIELITVQLLENEKTLAPKLRTKALGLRKFKIRPRIGETVDLDDMIFEVIMIRHSKHGSGHGADLFVKKVCNHESEFFEYLNEKSMPKPVLEE